MEKIKVVLVDDEEGAREFLKNILEEYCFDILVVGVTDSVDAAYAVIKETQPDLVFLDIEMPQKNGFELMELFDEINFNVVFVTAYDQYAIRAIKLSALDYLLKPVDIEDLQTVINKHKKAKLKKQNITPQINSLLTNLKNTNQVISKIAIPTQNGFQFININEIIRCEADGNYACFQLKNGSRVMVSKPLSEYEEILIENHFLRVHRSHLINLKEVKQYIKGDGGYVIMSDGSNVEISRRKKAAFLEQLNTF